MNFPQFWARGRSGEFFTWRWSFQSLAEAQALAEEAAQQLADRFRMGLLPPRHGGYYPNRPFREQILQEIKNGAGEVSAVITLNSYGCQVLNTKHVMFVDIDLPEPKRSGGFFQRLRKRRGRALRDCRIREHGQDRELEPEQLRLGVARLPHPFRAAVACHARLV